MFCSAYLISFLPFFWIIILPYSVSLIQTPAQLVTNSKYLGFTSVPVVVTIGLGSCLGGWATSQWQSLRLGDRTQWHPCNGLVHANILAGYLVNCFHLGAGFMD